MFVIYKLLVSIGGVLYLLLKIPGQNISDFQEYYGLG